MKKKLVYMIAILCFAFAGNISFACGPDCNCGCQEGKECTCNKEIVKTDDVKDCDCGKNCNCKEDNCDCGCLEGDNCKCKCAKDCNCKCSSKGCPVENKKNKKRFFKKKVKKEGGCSCGCDE